MKTLRKFVVGLIFLFVFFSLSRSLVKYQKTLQFYEGYKNEYEAEKKKNVQLKTQILKKTDPYEMERVMRDKLNMSQEGEVVVILPYPTPTPFVPTPTPKAVYHQWFDVFFLR